MTVAVFLILAAQYEQWSLPLAVVTAVPFGIFGGMVGAPTLALFFVPLFYYLIRGGSERLSAKRRSLPDTSNETPAANGAIRDG